MENYPVSKEEYVALAEFRHGLRRFLRFSEAAARDQGITPQQHQLLLSIKGLRGREWASVNELSERLQLQQHSVVGIIDRSEQAGLVARRHHSGDLRVTEVYLTEAGERILETLTMVHRSELQRTGEFLATLQGILGIAGSPGATDGKPGEEEEKPW